VQTLELRIPPVIQVFIVGSLMWTLEVALPSLGFTLPASPLLALAFAAVGVTFALLGVLEFRSAGTTVDPREPDQSVSLVDRGVYRVSRNPMYVGFLLVLIAWGIFLGNLASLSLLPTFVIYMNRYQIVPEERHMRAKFGEAYRHYEARVRRWV